MSVYCSMLKFVSKEILIPYECYLLIYNVSGTQDTRTPDIELGQLTYTIVMWTLEEWQAFEFQDFFKCPALINLLLAVLMTPTHIMRNCKLCSH